MPQDHLAGTAYRNGAGITSLVAGIVAALACLVPFIGGAITIAAAVVALVEYLEAWGPPDIAFGGQQYCRWGPVIASVGTTGPVSGIIY